MREVPTKVHDPCSFQDQPMLPLLETGVEIMKVIDLFSGLGGFSEAFAQDPIWDVLRIENNHLLAADPHTMIADALTLDPAGFDCDLLLASPPCTEFSLAYNAPQSIASRRNEENQPNMDLVKCALEWDRSIKPKFFLMENVSGSSKYFTPLVKKFLYQPKKVSLI